MKIKYPRTPHLPWSLGATSDDKMLSDISHFEGQKVVVTEKVDGENTTMGRDYIHARSLDSKHHVSRSWVKCLHSEIRHLIPNDWRICGENVYAKHSILYQSLPSYFLVFGIYEGKEALSWEDTVEWAGLLNLHTVPVLYQGIWDEEKVKLCFTGQSDLDGDQEGYVVRLSERFNEFGKSVAKFVRKGHVQCDDHWMEKAVVPNKLNE